MVDLGRIGDGELEIPSPDNCFKKLCFKETKKLEWYMKGKSEIKRRSFVIIKRNNSVHDDRINLR